MSSVIFFSCTGCILVRKQLGILLAILFVGLLFVCCGCVNLIVVLTASNSICACYCEKSWCRVIKRDIKYQRDIKEYFDIWKKKLFPISKITNTEKIYAIDAIGICSEIIKLDGKCYSELLIYNFLLRSVRYVTTILIIGYVINSPLIFYLG